MLIGLGPLIKKPHRWKNDQVIQAFHTTSMIEEENGLTSVCMFPLQHKEAVHHHLVSCHKCLESKITQERGLFFLIPFSALVRSYFADKFLSD